MIGRLPGTPQVAPKSPKTYPGSSRDPPELSEGPQDPQDALGATKPHGNQQKRKQNNIKRLKTTETSNMQTLSVQFMCSIS